MSTLETQYRNYLKENPSSTVDFNLWKVWHGNQIKQALTDMQNKYKECKATDFYDEQDPRGMSTSEYDAYMKAKKEQKQHIVDLMKVDEELGLYDKEPKQYPKTFKDLFANTGIEPTTDENGDIHYNFKASMKEETVEEYFLDNIKNMLQFNNDALAIRFMEKYYHAKKEKELNDDRDDFAIKFANWLRKEDIQENAEKYFHYSDKDMLNVFKEKNK